MRTMFALATLASVAVLTVFAGSANAILGGTPDTTHTYVGMADNGVFVCTATLVSPRILVTAAHCFSDSDSAYGNDSSGNPRVEVTFDQQGFFTQPAPTFFMGTYYFDPEFCTGCGKGLPGFDTHDVAIIVLDEPQDRGFAELPPVGYDATLKTGTKLDVSGYGVQHFGKPVPCDPSCRKQPDAFFTRLGGPANLLNVGKGTQGEFIKISGNTSQGKAGQCFGDSGGPLFIAGTNLLIGETSVGTNEQCAGVGYDLRLDTESAQDFIYGTAASLGLSIP
jgi:secreted trypsin-like serine protease